MSHTLTGANWFYNLSHGTDNKLILMPKFH